MLNKTLRKLESYRNSEPQRGADGQMHAIDRVTRIPMEQCERLAELHSRIKPDLSLETGLAYGYSTLPILDAMTRLNYGHHLAIDPYQMQNWDGVACAAVEDLGFSERFTWHQSQSDRVLVDLIQSERRIQFAFLDGTHYFEGIVTDICLIDQIMDVDGILVVNDMWLPAVRSVASYVTNNLRHYQVIPSVHENIFVVTKKGRDERRWDHFAPFDGEGEEKRAPRGFVRKLFRSR